MFHPNVETRYWRHADVRQVCKAWCPLSQETLIEIRDLLTEVRDLMLPIADAHRGEFDRRQAVRAVLSTEKRKEAWALADGDLSQRDLAKKAGLDEGAASRLFKSLRELGAIVGEPNPKRAFEV